MFPEASFYKFFAINTVVVLTRQFGVKFIQDGGIIYALR